MLKNYVRIAFRHLAKSRLHSFINIGGLAIGMAVALLIGLWVTDGLSYDTYNTHYDHTALSWWIFGAAGAGALLITLLTVSFQTIKAALANPVKSLRTE